MAKSAPYHRVLLVLLLFRLSHASANCFNKNGTDRNGPTGIGVYKPCNLTTAHSMCCAITDHCRPDGLCTDSAGASLWRESCTDQSWRSPYCVNLCVDGIAINQPPGQSGPQGNNQMADNDVTVTQCSDGSYCCNSEANACCSANQGVWLVNGTTTNVRPYASPSNSAPVSALSPPFIPRFSTEAAGNSTSSAPSPTLSSTNSSAIATSLSRPSTSAFPPPAQVHTSTIARGVIGGTAGLALIIAATWYLARRQALRSASPKASLAEPGKDQHSEPGQERYYTELDHKAHCIELEMEAEHIHRTELEQELRGEEKAHAIPPPSELAGGRHGSELE